LFSHSSYEAGYSDGVKQERLSLTLRTPQALERSLPGMTCNSMLRIQPQIPSQGVA